MSRGGSPVGKSGTKAVSLPRPACGAGRAELALRGWGEGESPRGRRQLDSRRVPLTRNLLTQIPASLRTRGEAKGTASTSTNQFGITLILLPRLLPSRKLSYLALASAFLRVII